MGQDRVFVRTKVIPHVYAKVVPAKSPDLPPLADAAGALQLSASPQRVSLQTASETVSKKQRALLI